MNSYSYDANGNLTSRNGNSISYTSYNLPGVINAGTNSSTLSYGAWRKRSKQVAISGGSTETTISVAGLLEKVTRDGVTEYRHRIAATPGVVALYTRRSAGSPLSDTYYVHRDHLGSPELLTRANGTALVGLSFSAYGERRDTDWDGPIGSTDLATLGNTTREGYTGHAMLDGVGLVHMNGRVYDPVIGRFLSRDPLVDGRVSQGANGYAYVWNNPLTLNDPSGYEVSADDIKKQWEDAGGGRNEEVVVTASRLRLYLGSLAREYNGRLSDLTAALGPSTTDLADAGAGGGTARVGSGGENEPLPQTQNPEACKSAASAPIGLAATNQVFRSNSDPNKRFTVNASLLTIRQTNSFNSNGRARGVVQGSNWAIFGSVTLQQNPGGSISLRPDRYDFEQNEVTTAEDLFRNIETYFGFYAATYGGLTEYWADLTGGNHATDFSFDFICQPTVVR